MRPHQKPPPRPAVVVDVMIDSDDGGAISRGRELHVVKQRSATVRIKLCAIAALFDLGRNCYRQVLGP